MNRPSTSQKPYLSPAEVAQILMVSPATIRLWASKGELDAVSTPGGHRRFLRHEIERFARDKNLQIQIPSDTTLRLLIVDDDVQVANYLSRLFDRADPATECMVATTGYSAGRIVQYFQPHVVLLDLMMPELNGFDVCKQIKLEPATKATRVIAMTGFYNDENVRRALEAGAECCLAKPFDQDKLMALLNVKFQHAAPVALD